MKLKMHHHWNKFKIFINKNNRYNKLLQINNNVKPNVVYSKTAKQK